MCYSAIVKRVLTDYESKYGYTWVKERLEEFEGFTIKDPLRFPKMVDRIFPGSYAPVLFEKNGKRLIEPMRYSTYPPKTTPSLKSYTSFNARRDNLGSKFWSNAFMKNHGFIILNGFYEWVAVKDLLLAEVVTLTDVEAEFAKQIEERKKKILGQGKKYKPTPTELKQPIDRQIIIEFIPNDRLDLVVPVIFSEQYLDEYDRLDKGFAIITDEPPLEVSQAGHDRCPVILDTETISRWMKIEGSRPEDMIQLLGDKSRKTFVHRLPLAA